MRSECSEFENAAPLCHAMLASTQMLLGQAGRKYLHEYKSNQNFLHFAGDFHNVLIHISWTLTSAVRESLLSSVGRARC